MHIGHLCELFLVVQFVYTHVYAVYSTCILETHIEKHLYSLHRIILLHNAQVYNTACLWHTLAYCYNSNLYKLET